MFKRKRLISPSKRAHLCGCTWASGNLRANRDAACWNSLLQFYLGQPYYPFVISDNWPNTNYKVLLRLEVALEWEWCHAVCLHHWAHSCTFHFSSRSRLFWSEEAVRSILWRQILIWTDGHVPVLCKFFRVAQTPRLLSHNRDSCSWDFWHRDEPVRVIWAGREGYKGDQMRWWRWDGWIREHLFERTRNYLAG